MPRARLGWAQFGPDPTFRGTTTVIGRGFWRIAPFVLCVALYWPVLAQHLLSDDMAVAYALHQWHQHGELWQKLWGKFAIGLDSPSFYYRPLTFVSFGVNYTLAGVAPLTWHLDRKSVV